MILVDTSIWIDHFRAGNARLQSLLLAEQVACHPFVIGELACGNLRRREEILRLLSDLPACEVMLDADVLALLERHRLFGRGIGWVDAHLIAAAVSRGFALWTSDRRLDRIAAELGLAARW